MTKEKAYKIYESEKNFKALKFKYREGMTIDLDGDSYPIEIGVFKTLEEAEKELKKLKTEIVLWGDPRTVTVTEYFIEEQRGFFDEDGEFELLEGGDTIAFSELKDPATVKEIEEKCEIY